MVNKKYIILKVREIISSELSLSDMNPELNFFDHGGDSVRAISICDRLKSQFSIDIELHDFFEFQAIKDIESRVISYTLEKIESTKDEVKNELSNDSLLLTSGQKQIFNYCSLNSKSTSNIISTALVINKRFSESELKNKLNDILNSNDIFKRRLTRQGNHLLFERKENHNIKLIVHNISYSEAIEYVEEDVAREMPLFGDELYEFQVFLTGEDSYIFYSRFHHIIIDGLSNVQFFFNLFSPSIKKATKDFDQYYFYEEKYLQSDSYKDSLNVWGEKISSYRGDLENSKILPKKINNQSVVYRVKYDDQLISKIDALNLVPNTSFFQKTLFIMSLSLAKVLNKDFQSIGISTHGRSNLKFLRTLGNFTNTLPLLLKYSGKDTIEQSFLHFLEEFNFLTKNQKMPLLEVVKEESKNSNFSLFNMIFSYLDLTDIYNKLDELGVNILEIDRKYSHTDLDMYVTKVKKELFFCFEFNEDFINLKEVKDLVENFVDILSSITSGQCNTTLGSLVPSLKKSDKKSILHGDISSSVPHFLDFITNSHLSDKIAIKSDQGSISYRDLIRRAYQVRNSLRSLGITSNERVAIYQERSIDYIVSMLGCMYNGNPYIPLDIGYPEERTKFILEDSKAKVIITSKHLSKVSTDVESLYFENILKEGYRTVSSSVINQSSVCYILYTSGSTGNPKGVEVTFSNLNNFLFSMASTPEMSSDDTLLAVTTFCFDISFLEIFLPLYCSSSLYLASSSESRDSQKIIDIIAKEDITVMQATPVTWSLLIKSGWKGSQSLKALCGGEKLDYSLAQNILSRVDSLWNMYGPTETTIWSSVDRVLAGKQISIGKPIYNTNFYILDEKLEPVGEGEVGELYISGDGVSKGYLNAPQKTSRCFISSSINGKDQIIYKTGDLASLASGSVFCHGRCDNQIKIRGYRIEVDEIKTYVKQFLKDEVEGVEILLVGDDYMKKLVLYLESAQSNDNHGELKRYLQKNLPSYMIPTEIFNVEKFPKTLNNKIDLKELQKFKRSSNVFDKKDIEDFSISSKVSQIWSSVLEIDTRSTEEDFFSQGGNSIKALEFVESINSVFNINLDLHILFEFNTLTKLSELISDMIIEKKILNKEYEHIVTLNYNINNSVNIFFIHGVGGSVLNYKHFQYAFPNKNVFAVKANGLTDKIQFNLSLPEMAKIYSHEISEISRGNEVHLVGGSMGGVIAYELADCLYTRSHNLNKVVLLDSYSPGKSSLLYRSKIICKFIKTYLRSEFENDETNTTKSRLVELRNLYALARYYPQKKSTVPIHLIKAKLNGNPISEKEWIGHTSGEFILKHIDAYHEDIIESEELIPMLSTILDD